jgi:hypothetical protein
VAVNPIIDGILWCTLCPRAAPTPGLWIIERTHVTCEGTWTALLPETFLHDVDEFADPTVVSAGASARGGVGTSPWDDRLRRRVSAGSEVRPSVT